MPYSDRLGSHSYLVVILLGPNNDRNTFDRFFLGLIQNGDTRPRIISLSFRPAVAFSIIWSVTCRGSSVKEVSRFTSSE